MVQVEAVEGAGHLGAGLLALVVARTLPRQILQRGPRAERGTAGEGLDAGDPRRALGGVEPIDVLPRLRGAVLQAPPRLHEVLAPGQAGGEVLRLLQGGGRATPALPGLGEVRLRSGESGVESGAGLVQDGLDGAGVHLGAGRGQAQAIGGIGRRVGGDGLGGIGLGGDGLGSGSLGGTRALGGIGRPVRPVRVVVRPVRPGQQRNERLGGAAHVGAGRLRRALGAAGPIGELLLKVVVDAGAEDVAQQQVPLVGAGPQEARELALGQDHRLRELAPAEPDRPGQLRPRLVGAQHGVVGAAPVRAGQPPHLEARPLRGGARAAALGPPVGGRAAHPVGARRGGEHQLDDGLGLRPRQAGADAVLGGVVGVGHVPVEGEDDRVDDRRLPRPGGAGQQEQAGGGEAVEVDRLGARIGADGGHGQSVQAHHSPPWEARTAS